MNKENRIAVVDPDKCKPKKCRHECMRSCPINLGGKQCVTVDSIVSTISESLCIGCNMCVKRCPFGAITIVNLPSSAGKTPIYRYLVNSFALYGELPVFRQGNVIGLLGANGTGKTTIVKILSNEIKPNLGNFSSENSEQNIISYYRGSELQTYFKKLYTGQLRVSIKPQHVLFMAEKTNGNVLEYLKSQDEKGILEQIADTLELRALYNKNIETLSGGELQKFSIAVTGMKNSQVYIFDEPSSYLDIKQRLIVSDFIRSLATP